MVVLNLQGGGGGRSMEVTRVSEAPTLKPGGGGGTLGISGWGCAAGTLEPLAYTRASSAEFCYPILE